MHLSPRLYSIAKQVDKSKKIADIGTDHAYIPIFLVENEISKDIIASDVNLGPLEIAKKQVNKYKYDKYIDFRLGSGLEVLKPNEVDNVIIAGMGGILIRDILANNLSIAYTIDKLILQPMIAQKELREFLINNGFKIVQEDLAIEDQRIYQIIIAEKGTQEVEDEIFYEIGHKLIENKHPLLPKLLNKKENQLNKILLNCRDEDSNNAQKKIEECEQKIKKIKEVRGWL